MEGNENIITKDLTPMQRAIIAALLSALCIDIKQEDDDFLAHIIELGNEISNILLDNGFILLSNNIKNKYLS